LSSTEVYTRVELSDLAEVLARCHPRERSRRQYRDRKGALKTGQE
jgi:site-specific recombinase XerC